MLIVKQHSFGKRGRQKDISRSKFALHIELIIEARHFLSLCSEREGEREEKRETERLLLPTLIMPS